MEDMAESSASQIHLVKAPLRLTRDSSAAVLKKGLVNSVPFFMVLNQADTLIGLRLMRKRFDLKVPKAYGAVLSPLFKWIQKKYRSLSQ